MKPDVALVAAATAVPLSPIVGLDSSPKLIVVHDDPPDCGASVTFGFPSPNTPRGRAAFAKFIHPGKRRK